MKKFRKAKQKCLTHSSPEQLVGDWFLERKYIVSGCHFLHVNHTALSSCAASPLLSGTNPFFLVSFLPLWSVEEQSHDGNENDTVTKFTYPGTPHSCQSSLIFKSTNQTNINSEKLKKWPCTTETIAKKNGSLELPPGQIRRSHSWFRLCSDKHQHCIKKAASSFISTRSLCGCVGGPNEDSPAKQYRVALALHCFARWHTFQNEYLVR